jgi:hypothetical protein
VTKAQQVFERVEALTATGVRKADAFRQVADEYGQPFNSIRGSYYSYARSTNDTTARPRNRRRQSPEAAIESAVIALTKAMEAIDAETEAAKQHAEEAQAAYEQLRDTAEERTQSIQAKIDALAT